MKTLNKQQLRDFLKDVNTSLITQPELRTGQAMYGCYTAVYKLTKEDKLLNDPFYDDRNIPAFLLEIIEFEDF